ncbi:hypothetical protein FRB91_002315 [Serendipita sp. 411]|nr:hypothetical protein FRC19_004745 [Serendipita sp. 401]KAG8844785.1 hypothetical protein FRB91_002315 [Serendipita sp. 411]KAG9056866.1 hypothetical protein FS842_009307 [Serendipita sp. 407]
MSYGGPPTGPPPFGGPPGGPPPGGPPMGPPMGHPMGHPGGYGAPPPAPGWGSPPPMMPGGGGGPPVGTPGGTAHGLGQGGGSVVQDTTGVFEGCSYKIDHRDSNSILSAQLQQGYTIKAKPGAMVAMAASVQVQGAMKFSFTKMMTGGEMSESRYTGPGELILAPEIWGDIVPITVQPNVTWSVGKDAYLACTMGVVRTTKSQGFMKGLMSGEGFFVAKVSGQGILFVQSIGAILKRTLRPGEEWIVDNGHLVAWSASYKMERINTAGGGMFSASHTGEGMVCRFSGPGEVYLQTRNPESLGQWIAAQVPRQG